MMKKSNLILIAVLFTAMTYWWGTQSPVKQKTVKLDLLPHYSEKEAIEKSVPQWSEDKKEEEHGASGFAEYYRSISIKPGIDAKNYNPGYKLDEYENARRQVRLKSAKRLDWKERGPGNVGGRTRGVIVDPDDVDCNTWFAGSVSGGIWKTSNAGQSWSNLTPDLPNLAIASLAIANSNTQVIYAGTGEGFGNADAVYGDGIFVSKDKGSSWSQLSSTAQNNDFKTVNRIVVDPLNEDVLVVATNTSLQRTEDGGMTWQNVFDDDAKVQQVILTGGAMDTLYASVNNKGVIKSTDKGLTWSYALEISQRRLEIAVSPTHPNVLYAITENSNLFLSEDNGKTWLGTVDMYGRDIAFLGDQGWYDAALAVSPLSPFQLLVGGIDMHGVEILGDTVLSDFRVDTVGVGSYMAFVNHNNAYFGGAANVNAEYYDSARIELQFGPGKKQKAHRFTVPSGATSGVAAENYTYQDYVEVPFEVWDVDNNRQLMVSFRDQEGDGVFDLEWQNDQLLQGREYLWVNDVNYSESPDENIAQSGGHLYRYVFYTWPVLRDGIEWSPTALPESKIVISTQYWEAKKRVSDRVTDAYSVEEDKPYVHPDMHNIQIVFKSNGTPRILVAHDSGLDYSDDMGTTWVSTDNGYNTTQYYGMDKKKGENRYVGGMQDNGTYISLDDPGALSTWIEGAQGDGFDAVWHPFTGELLNSWQNNNVVKIAADLQSWVYLSDVPDKADDNAPFFTKLSYSVDAPNNLFMVGASGVSYSKDFGDTWAVADMPDSLWSYKAHNPCFVEPSLLVPDVVWAVARMDTEGSVMLSRDGGVSFEPAGTTDDYVNRPSGLVTHPSNEKSAFVLFSYSGESKILRTTDYGESWTDITAFENGVSQNGFPDVQVYSLLVMPHDTSTLWVGTEIGLFVSEDNGGSWSYADNGLPAVSIWDMKIRDKQVLLGTHGRGLWTVDIPEIPDRVSLPYFMDVNLKVTNELFFDYVQAEVYDSLFMVVDSETLLELPIATDTTVLQSGDVDLDLPWGQHRLQLMAYKGGQSYLSATYPIEVLYNSPKYSYANSFDEASNDFYCENMAIADSGDLEVGMALHSVHPYSENQSVKAALMTPIILSKGSDGSGTKLRYSDIPMVEAGEAGASFGEAGFKDYVMPVASKDGENWMPLMYGYDFNSIKDEATLLGLSVDSKPTNALFSEKEVDLLSFFDEGDTVFIAFYLYSDDQTTAWGWVIDDVFIGLDVPSALDVEQGISHMNLYPVPCTDVLNVAYSEQYSPDSYVVYDYNGRAVKRGVVHSDDVLRIETSGLKAATYILELKGEGEVLKSQFVVKH